MYLPILGFVSGSALILFFAGQWEVDGVAFEADDPSFGSTFDPSLASTSGSVGSFLVADVGAIRSDISRWTRASIKLGS